MMLSIAMCRTLTLISRFTGATSSEPTSGSHNTSAPFIGLIQSEIGLFMLPANFSPTSCFRILTAVYYATYKATSGFQLWCATSLQHFTQIQGSSYGVRPNTRLHLTLGFWPRHAIPTTRLHLALGFWLSQLQGFTML